MTVKIRTILCSLTAGIQRIVFKINHHREQLCPAVFRPPTQGWPPPEVTLNQATRAAHTWNTNNCPLPFCLVLSHSWAQARPRLPIWSNSRSPGKYSKPKSLKIHVQKYVKADLTSGLQADEREWQIYTTHNKPNSKLSFSTPIKVFIKSCSITQTYGVKTNFTQAIQ